MNTVTQEHLLGCGVACVAFILKQSYQEVFDQMDTEKIMKNGVFFKDIKVILAKYNKNYFLKYVKPGTSICIDNAMVYVKKSPQYPAGHYLVYYQGKWMNPWVNFPTIKSVKSGWQKVLPGKAQYVLIPA